MIKKSSRIWQANEIRHLLRRIHSTASASWFYYFFFLSGGGGGGTLQAKVKTFVIIIFAVPIHSKKFVIRWFERNESKCRLNIRFGKEAPRAEP